MSSYFVDDTFPSNLRQWKGHDVFVCADVVWKRPSGITRKPKFVVDGAKRHDLDQGALGNCWFISAAAALATHHPDRFKLVVPLEQSFTPPLYTGEFHFNFFRNGRLTPVIIDDFLPTRGKKLMYCRNKERPDEFWPCLLEKAYAKFYGSYEALDGGHIVKALVDLTGGRPEVIDLRGQTRGSSQLYNQLIDYHRQEAVMGAAILHSDKNAKRKVNGLICGHAYSITGFHTIEAGGREVNLIRLRNPWGRGEWVGAWSDKSKEMSALPKDVKRTLRLYIQDDGEFWMEFDDFISMFDEIEICHL